jgi:hypothetical protein
MNGFISSLVTQTLLLTYPFNTGHTAFTDLHTFQFTVAYALGFPVFTSRLLATDLNTETSTSNRYKYYA